MRKIVTLIMVVAFLANTLVTPACAQAVLPKPGEMVGLSPAFRPAMLAGVKVFADDPFRLDFIIDQGTPLRKLPEFHSPERNSGSGTPGVPEGVSQRLIKYFLAALTVPRKDLWVNLSPYEKDRIVPDGLGQTEMGRDLLAQDYILKQITASLIYPEGEAGKAFWARVYRQVEEKFGTIDIPVDTFNKVWIVPAKAAVFEGKDAAYVIESRLKVMLESDYLAMSQADGLTPLRELPEFHSRSSTQGNGAPGVPEGAGVAKQVLREIIVPILEEEVNEGANFAQLRQVYNSLILATWYKRKIKESLLSKVYVDQKKIAGVNIDDAREAEKIWARYVEAFKAGVFNYIKEERDGQSGELIPKKYFSGGVNPDPAEVLRVSDVPSDLPDNAGTLEVDQVRLQRALIDETGASSPWENFWAMLEQAGKASGYVELPSREGVPPVKLKVIDEKKKAGLAEFRVVIDGEEAGNFYLSVKDGFLLNRMYYPFGKSRGKYEKRGISDSIIRWITRMAADLGLQTGFIEGTSSLGVLRGYQKYLDDIKVSVNWGPFEDFKGSFEELLKADPQVNIRLKGTPKDASMANDQAKLEELLSKADPQTGHVPLGQVDGRTVDLFITRMAGLSTALKATVSVDDKPVGDIMLTFDHGYFNINEFLPFDQDPSFKGNGIARKIIEWCDITAKELGLKKSSAGTKNVQWAYLLSKYFSDRISFYGRPFERVGALIAQHGFFSGALWDYVYLLKDQPQWALPSPNGVRLKRVGETGDLYEVIEVLPGPNEFKAGDRVHIINGKVQRVSVDPQSGVPSEIDTGLSVFGGLQTNMAKVESSSSDEAMSNEDLEQFFGAQADKATGRWEIGKVGEDSVSLNIAAMKNLPGWMAVGLFLNGKQIGDFHVGMSSGYLQIKTFEPYYQLFKKDHSGRGIADLVIRFMAVLAKSLGAKMANTLTRNVQLVHLYRKHFADWLFEESDPLSAHGLSGRDLGAMIDEFGFFSSRIWGALYVVDTQQEANTRDEDAVHLEKEKESADQYEVVRATPHGRFVVGDRLKIVGGSVSVWNKETLAWELTTLSVFGGALTNKLHLEGEPKVDGVQPVLGDNAERLFPDRFQILDMDKDGGIARDMKYRFETSILGIDMVRMWRNKVDRPGAKLYKVVDDRPFEAALGNRNAEHPFGILLLDANTQEPLGIGWWQFTTYGAYKRSVRQLFGFQFKADLDLKARSALMAKVLSDMISYSGPARGDLFIVHPFPKYRRYFEKNLQAKVDPASVRYGMDEEDPLTAAFYRVDVASARDYIKEVLASYDKAQASAEGRDNAETGGIDLDPLDDILRVDRDAQVGALSVDPAMLAEYGTASGFTPVVVNVQPLNDLQGFLGLKK